VRFYYCNGKEKNCGRSVLASIARYAIAKQYAVWAPGSAEVAGLKSGTGESDEPYDIIQRHAGYPETGIHHHHHQ